MPSGLELFDFALGEIIENIIQSCLEVFFPGPISTATGIWGLITSVFDIAGLISRIIDYIRYCNSLPGVLLGVFQLCIVAALPIFFIVIAVNVVVRLLRKFIMA